MARLRHTRSTSSSRPDGDAAALINRVGALLLAAHDSMAEAAAQAVGRGAQAPAALVVLREFLEDATIQQLSGVIGLTHSATVRLVDRLVTDGYVLRQGGGRDGRTVAIRLTKAGAAAAERVRQARSGAVEALLQSLNDQERRELAGHVDKLLVGVTRRRLESRARGEQVGGWMCRLCDLGACGRPEGRCPVAATPAAETS
jgi:DNA-binding MarR family transcriptional regulator